MSNNIIEIKVIETNQPPYLDDTIGTLKNMIQEFMNSRPSEKWVVLNIQFIEYGSNYKAFLVRYDE